MRSEERFPYPRPTIRPLKIYAFDPMNRRELRNRISVETRNEPLQPGPVGNRIAVIDYDAHQECFYVPIDLDQPSILMQGGMDYGEGDPRFHQQIVYAVASRILEIVDRALGRPVSVTGNARPLRLFPHAFAQPNAYYDAGSGLLFGYFKAAKSAQGANIPGQFIFSCLSHDIIAHELTHAVINELSPRLLRNPNNYDTPALHESIADLVCVLHRFSFAPVVRDEIVRTGGKLDPSGPLMEVGAQFGTAMGMEHALRNVYRPAEEDQYERVLEEHDRGMILSSAILESLFEAYRNRVRDLFQIARLPAEGATDGTLHPDLAERLTAEASRAALSILTMCLRSFDYLPPVDVTFGDFLRALVTADRDMVPDDPHGQRRALIDACRKRGIYASKARSLAEESLAWEGLSRSIPPLPEELVSGLTRSAQAFHRIRPDESEPRFDSGASLQHLVQYARRNARALHLSASLGFNVSRARYGFRVAPDGQLVVDIIVQLVQRDPSQPENRRDRGVTIIAAADGTVRYVIPNQPIPARLARNENPVPNQQQAVLRTKTAKSRGPAPFAQRYRMSPERYRRLYPDLARIAGDVERFKEWGGQ